MAEAIIGCALLAIGEALIGFVDVFEFLFCSRITRIFVGVELHREFAESRFQFGFGGRAAHAKCVVIISLGHVSSRFAQALTADKKAAGEKNSRPPL